ncbi:MAG: Hsp20/alpha crystallin family protein [Spirochaetota bacterium]
MTTQVVKRTDKNLDKKDYCIVPSVDIYETDNEYVLKADMPGVPKENVEITFNNNELEINGKIDEVYTSNNNLTYREFTLCNYNRKFLVSDKINVEGINASLENGVLTVTLPKREEAKPKRIEIKAS